MGILNSLIQQYQPLELRTDKGGLWENFLIVERLKSLQAQGLRPNRYFWRTHDQAEVDYVEENDGILMGYEFKWAENKGRTPATFLKSYPNSDFRVVHTGNFEAFLES